MLGAEGVLGVLGVLDVVGAEVVGVEGVEGAAGREVVAGGVPVVVVGRLVVAVAPPELLAPPVEVVGGAVVTVWVPSVGVVVALLSSLVTVSLDVASSSAGVTRASLSSAELVADAVSDVVFSSGLLLHPARVAAARMAVRSRARILGFMGISFLSDMMSEGYLFFRLDFFGQTG